MSNSLTAKKPSTTAGPRLGFWLETPHHQACEIAANCGFSVVVLDMEHGSLSDRDADLLIPFCAALGLEVYSRVSETSRASIQHALDAGAAGVILPQIRSLAEAEAAIAYAKFPPLGTRGFGYSRIQRYSAVEPTWTDAQNVSTRCYVMIETAEAVEQAGAIAALPSVDGLFVGPADLALSRGQPPGRWNDAAFADLDRVGRAARAAGKSFATAGGHNAECRRIAASHDAHFVTVADDLSALVAGFQKLFDAVAEA